MTNSQLPTFHHAKDIPKRDQPMPLLHLAATVMNPCSSLNQPVFSVGFTCHQVTGMLPLLATNSLREKGPWVGKKGVKKKKKGRVSRGGKEE